MVSFCGNPKNAKKLAPAGSGCTFPHEAQKCAPVTAARQFQQLLTGMPSACASWDRMTLMGLVWSGRAPEGRRARLAQERNTSAQRET